MYTEERRQETPHKSTYVCPRGTVNLHIGTCPACGAAEMPHPDVWFQDDAPPEALYECVNHNCPSKGVACATSNLPTS